jgi:uncharacterized protein YbjT (DUF2867 family)
MNILITGASGNVGQAIIRHFLPQSGNTLYKASREKKASGANSSVLYFDFDQLEESFISLKRIDILFLLRPPEISNVKKYFKPLIDACTKTSVTHIVFLSVQGADTATYIPHARIEKMIRESGIAYTFIRPAYFMQNLSTTLQGDIRDRNMIFLPAGRAKFNWIDVEDIGLAIARILENPGLHTNKIYTLTGNENLSFEQTATFLTEVLHRKITYISPNLINFYFSKKREGIPSAFIMVMILLHFLPRFQQQPDIHPDFMQLTGQEPNTLKNFIETNQNMWQIKNPV